MCIHGCIKEFFSERRFYQSCYLNAWIFWINEIKISRGRGGVEPPKHPLEYAHGCIIYNVPRDIFFIRQNIPFLAVIPYLLPVSSVRALSATPLFCARHFWRDRHKGRTGQTQKSQLRMNSVIAISFISISLMIVWALPVSLSLDAMVDPDVDQNILIVAYAIVALTLE